MGVEGEGVEPAEDCGGTGGHCRGRQPVDAAWTRGWRGGPEEPAAPRGRAETDGGAAGADPRGAGAGGRSVRLPWGGLDRQACGDRHPAGVRGARPSQPRRHAPAGGRLERAEADRARQRAQRRGDRGVVDRAVAGPKKGADQEGRTIIWVDESGFYLLPGAVRTDAPRGQTPVLRLPLSRDHLAVISAITPDDPLLMVVQERPFKSPDIVRFPKHLPRHIPGKLLVIWDGAPIQRGQPVKDFLAQGGAERIRLERFPGYAPDLNPDEGIWNYLKRVELGNVCCQTLDHVRRHLRLATARLRHKPSVIQGCARECGL